MASHTSTSSALRSITSRILRADILESSFHANAPISSPVSLSCSRNASTSTPNVVSLHAVRRSASGSRAAAKLRAQGLVPGTVFSFERENHKGAGEDNGVAHDQVLLAFEKKAIGTLHQKIGSYGFACQVFDIHVTEPDASGEARATTDTYRVLGRQIHTTAASAEPENVTFIDFHPNRKVRVEVPLRTFGREMSPGIRAGGRVNWIRRTVPCLVDVSEAEAVPASFEVDISGLEVNDKVLWTELDVPVGVQVLLKDRRQPVLKMARK